MSGAFFVAQKPMNGPTLERQLCSAHSSRTGDPCRLPPILGATVCRNHGGAAPQVRRSAHERLAEMVDPLLTELFRIAQSGENDSVRLAAVKDALDRAGYKPKEHIAVDLQLIKEIHNAALDAVV
jgi:HEAT repeat protein